MELLSLAILVVAVGALFWLGWSLAPFLFAGLFIYAVFRYRRQIPKMIRAFFTEFRNSKKK
ncbi:MAG: hypothetical protein PHE68_05185 [Candidatus Peribacteraceae bacterium]|nr:hypothetical protein [Candidatus Peribacteraceae bacterium]MDD5075086.1 hypothetical protein [Candidatus Peribacteraceae bacterium]